MGPIMSRPPLQGLPQRPLSRGSSGAMLPSAVHGPSPRGARLRLRPMGQCLNRTFSSLRPQPHSRSPRPLPAAPLGVRGLAEQAESTETKRFKEPTDPLLSAREVSPQTNLPADEALERRDLRRQKPSGDGFKIGGGVPLHEVLAAVDHVQVETGIALLGQRGPFGGRATVLLPIDE